MPKRRIVSHLVQQNPFITLGRRRLANVLNLLLLLNKQRINEGGMNITIQVPDDIANALQATWQDMPRAVLESLALEGYRSGVLSDGQLRRLLGFETRFQVHAFLKEHDVLLNYRMEDLEHDREAAKRLGLG